MKPTNYKVIVVGESGAGKTTIIHHLLTGEFAEETSTTVGVEFKSFQCRVDDKDVKLQIWDTAGQEKFRSIAKSYFRNAVGALLVFDLSSRESFDSLAEWLQSIQTLSNPNSVIILIGNKQDLVSKRKISSSEAMSFAERNKISYIETSAKDGTNISDTFLRLAREISTKVSNGTITLPTLKSQPLIAPTYTAFNQNQNESNCSC